ncbi:unnamed protein product [Brassica oleracea]|uniref:(rape) hypothetical protein n=1 Tax=Brassica napus TaxID=3708 RepID=A0A816IHZ8_BRANA|nr:unnamed protein product [Brassica napus]
MGFVWFEALGFQFLALPVVVARAEVQRLGSKLHEAESIIWSIAAGKPISTKAWSHVSSKVLSPVENHSRLKIPDPTKTPSHPSCIKRAASAGVATPPAAN